MLRIAEHWYASDLGRQRQGNEDNFFVRAPLFVVADGMGGAQAGEVASEIAVRSFDDELPNGSLPEALASVIEQRQPARSTRSARADESLHGMGTTTTAAYVDDDEVVIAHVGDSRAYLLRDGDLIRLTKDHSLVGELVARGKLTEEQAEQHPQRSVITRALGPEANVQVDIDIFPAKAGDLFLLCSDGLTSMVHEPKLRPLFEEADSLEQLGKRADRRRQRGGRARQHHGDPVPARGGRGRRRARPRRPPRRATRTLASTTRSRATRCRRRARASRARGRERRRRAALVRGHRRGRGRLPPQRHRRAVGDPARRRDGRRARGAAACRKPRPDPPAEGPPRRTAPLPGDTGSEPPRKRRRRVPVGLIVVLAIVVLILAGGWMATRAVYFVGTDPRDDRTIAIFRGLPYDLPLGIELYERYAGSGVTIDDVPPARRKTFTDHKLRSKDDAENLVIALERGQIE